VRGLFVTGTDTEAGKTMLASALAATLAQRGERVAVLKPAVTGLGDAATAPPDHELLRRSARSSQAAEEIAPYRFEPPVSPHLAAELAGTQVEPARLVDAAHAAAASADALVVEGVGGLLVPLSERYSVRDFACELGLPVVIAARPGLGTINHTLLTLESARSMSLEVAAVVFTPWPARPSTMEVSNRATVERLGAVETFGLPHLPIGDAVPPQPGLPVQRWVKTGCPGVDDRPRRTAYLRPSYVRPSYVRPS
jgi:dethiobiotin synthetase